MKKIKFYPFVVSYLLLLVGRRILSIVDKDSCLKYLPHEEGLGLYSSQYKAILFDYNLYVKYGFYAISVVGLAYTIYCMVKRRGNWLVQILLLLFYVGMILVTYFFPTAKDC